MNSIIAISVGAVLGTLSRYFTTLYIGKISTSSFPYATLLINVSGSFVMGVLSALLATKMAGNQELKNLAMIGFLGSFTTFSAFSLDSINLIKEGLYNEALIYIFASVFLSIAALFIGIIITHKFC